MFNLDLSVIETSELIALKIRQYAFKSVDWLGAVILALLGMSFFIPAEAFTH